MVFVSVGMQKILFNRIFEYLKYIDDLVVIQCDINNVEHRDNYEIYNYLTPEEMKKYIDKCDLFISHGGPSNIMYALTKNKKVIVVPRMKKYHEHINDHQIIFADYLQKNNYAFVAKDEKEFIKCLNSKRKLNKYQSNYNNFKKDIEKEINRLLGE